MDKADTSQLPGMAVKPQYHHFIPRFILRNFAHPYNPPTDPKPAKKRKFKKGQYPGDPMLNIVDMAQEEAVLAEVPVAQTFGMTDMYRDFSQGTDQHELEKRLSQLESCAANIITKIRKSHESGAQDIWITRGERNDLRKFLFVMKYRGSGFHKRYNLETENEYSENDKEDMRKYMKLNGFRKPVDVWFSNLRAILDLKMDNKALWIGQLHRQMYPSDALWAVQHMQMFYLALCTPSNKDDEFLLTPNLYNIHEGPSSNTFDAKTGKMTVGPWTNYHEFSLISPRLAIVLRSFLLPEKYEDQNEKIKAWREDWLEFSQSQHDDPSNATSILQDLPIHLPLNSYTTIKDGKMILKDGEDGSWKNSHKFCFKFFKISTSHMNMINTIILEEANSVPMIAFKSQLALKRAMCYYLSTPTDAAEMRGFKQVFDTAKLTCFRKLEGLAKQLGSDTRAVYRLESLNVWEEEMLSKVDKTKSPPGMKPYWALGGNHSTLFFDLDQSGLMQKMRIKVDVWSQGLSDDIREDIRQKVAQLFCGLPPRRVWLYMKRIRCMLMNPAQRPWDVKDVFDNPVCWDGAEDAVAQAWQLFRAKDLARAIHIAAMNHTHQKRHPGFSIDTKVNMNEAGARQLHLTQLLVFGDAGSICDCGIPAIEKAAMLHRRDLDSMNLRRRELYICWPLEENLEMMTRCFVRKKFMELLKDEIVRKDLDALNTVFFTIIYPTVGKLIA